MAPHSPNQTGFPGRIPAPLRAKSPELRSVVAARLACSSATRMGNGGIAHVRNTDVGRIDALTCGTHARSCGGKDATMSFPCHKSPAQE